jgi:transcriptional regulator with XRE-family HTH domain
MSHQRAKIRARSEFTVMTSKEHKAVVIQRLEQVLKQKRMRQNELEARLGEKPGWLCNRKRFSFEVGDLLRVLEALSLTPGQFFCEDFEPMARSKRLQRIMDNADRAWREE